MIRLRSFLPFVLALAPLTVGCKKEEPPAPAPEAKPSAAMLPSGKGKLPLRTPIAPIPKFDPQAMKNYRLEVCYFGTLTLRQARDAYLGSLGKDEPSEKKIPSFGIPGASLPPAPPTLVPPKPGGSAAPSAGPVASAAPRASAAPGNSAFAGRKMADMGMRAPHERNARACTVAADLKEPAMPDVDAALMTFAPFSLELSRNIAAASVYYQREEYTKDKFERGKELHKKLVADFAKLDENADKLGSAIAAWHKEHPVDAAKLDEGERLVLTAYDRARGLVLSVLAKKIDTAAFKEGVAALAKDIEAIKTFGTNNPNDPWARITVPPLSAFQKAAEEAQAKISDKGIEPDGFLPLVNGFTSVIEAKHRALSRALTAKGEVVEPKAGPPTRRIPTPGQQVEHPDDHAGHAH
ncbi:DUF3829 domain-containing protein [Polyangium mundeleinium]|uniref:DUF3829 domain-containing protein n=1 Tax=Polyangium mundeleinium TaxID=2995306 RepID=A0ABT5EQM7_9BACT|nr:DUF3829 domain-containing protein [Polyangium mundeleinium]MDC0743639.1 DUF3829 domain-containing protein [Polyangium mundeleinium]